MATNRIRIGKQTEVSNTPGSIVTTNLSNEQQYTPPGSNGQVLAVVSNVPTWSGLNTWNNLQNVMASAVTEIPLITDAFIPRNGLHFIVNGTNNEIMWGGNLLKNTTINMIPQTGDGSPTTTGYNVLFDGQTSAPVGANTKYRIYQDNKTSTPNFIFDVQTYTSGANATAAFTANYQHHRWIGTGLGAQTIGGATNQVVGNTFAGQLNNFTTGATFTANSEYKSNQFFTNFGANTGTAAFPSIVAFTAGVAGSGNAPTVSVGSTCGLFINNQQGLGGITVGNVGRHFDIHVREGSYSANNCIFFCGGTAYSNIYNTTGTALVAGNWAFYVASTRTNYFRGNTMFGGATGVAATFSVQVSTDSAGKPLTGTWSIVSDRKTKQNIKAVKPNNSMDILKSLPDLSTFEHNSLYKAEGTGIGYMADELAKVPFNTEVVKKVKLQSVDQVQLDEYNKYVSLVESKRDEIYEANKKKLLKKGESLDSIADELADLTEKELKVYLRKNNIKKIEHPLPTETEVDTVNYHELLMATIDSVKQIIKHLNI